MTHSPFDLWKTSATDASFIEPSACAKRASKFENMVRIRNTIEYAAGVLVLFLFGATTVASVAVGEWLIGLSTLAITIGVVVVMIGLRRRAGNLDRRPEDACTVHLRRQYNRQYEALRDVPRWYLGPIIPGVVLFYVAIAAGFAEVAGWENALVGVSGPAAITTALFGVIALANWLGARSLKSKIDEIDALA